MRFPRGQSRVKRQRGAVLVMGALMLVMMVGIMGLAIESGNLYNARRTAQSAADAGALAAAQEIRRDALNTQATSLARSATAVNGFSHGSDGVTVTVNRPPLSGSATGNSSFVEVIVEKQVPSHFMQVLGQQVSTVKARAVSGLSSGASAPACMHILSPNASSALQMLSNSQITSKCAVQVNSTASNAINQQSTKRLTASKINVVGGYSPTSGASTKFSPIPTAGAAVDPDPLASLPVPNQTTDAMGFNPDGTCLENVSKRTSSRTWQPGVYCGGMWIDGGTHTLAGGYYVLRGRNSNGYSLEITNGSLQVAAGKTAIFYITGTSSTIGPIYLKTAGTISLSAPTSGRHAGILFFQNPSLGTSTMWHTIETDGSMTLNGVLYFKRSGLKIMSNAVQSAGSLYSPIVADRLLMDSNAVLNINTNYSSLPNGFVFAETPKNVVLAE